MLEVTDAVERLIDSPSADSPSSNTGFYEGVSERVARYSQGL